MDGSVPSTAGRRQFNDTALAKLLAEGVPRSVAMAFINHGIDKSGRYTALRDHVCKMEYVRYLLPRTAADYKDPMRVGQLAPYVVEQKAQRFFTEFAMSDVEAARFGGMFPEFLVIPRGTTYNQHSYFANKRYAEAELVVSMVFEHAAKHGGDWDPKSLTDVGGNAVWHAKRDRQYIHNDNPVLSVRDKARYVTRRVFSGDTGETTCNKKFSECSHKSQYGIGVHSTYDFSPKSLAFGMCKRDMRVFFLVINVIPGLGSMDAGQYEVDGMVITLHRPARSPPYVAYTFKHDASLEYKHPLSVHQAYLNTRATYTITKPSGDVVVYSYKIVSVRGNSLVACMERVDQVDVIPDSYQYAGPTRKVYHLSIKFLGVTDLVVDTEFFDRLVYMSAGARGAENYDIVSLYKYAKSLRQRVSINGIVLSSGYTMIPEQLVTAVVAAYAVSAAFRVESGLFFKEASGQIHARRGQGFVRDVLRVVGRTMLAPFGALASVLGDVTFYKKADRKLKAIVASKGAVEVFLDKPHAGAGMEFKPEMLAKPPAVNSSGLVKFAGGLTDSWVTPLQPGGWNAKLVPTVVNIAGDDKVFLSYSVPRLDGREQPVPGKAQFYNNWEFESPVTVKCEEYRSGMYAMALRMLVGKGAFDIVPLVLPVGDRLYRKRMRPMDGEVALTQGNRMVTESDTYVVFRGVGRQAVSLPVPECYRKGTCLRFVLFYEEEVSAKVRAAREGVQVGVASSDVAEAVRSLASSAVGDKFERFVVAPVEMYTAAEGESSDWEQVTPVSRRSVVSFEEHSKRPNYVEDMAKVGRYYMTGAVTDGTPPLSVASSDTLVYTARRAPLGVVQEEAASVGSGLQAPTESEDAVRAVSAEAQLFVDTESEVSTSRGQGASRFTELGSDEDEATSGKAADPESVSSSEVVWGRDALMEQLALCDAAKDVALASSAEAIDLAVGVARGEAPVTMWGAAMTEGKQGSPIPVRVTGDVFRNIVTGEKVDHMAVSDGTEVYDRICKPPPDGVYVTSDVMDVYTGAAIRDSIASVLKEPFKCSVTNMNGVAGCGKTTTITTQAKLGDVVLCETKGALRETAEKLRKLDKLWDNAQWTVDAFLCHRPRDHCNTLWVDESLRLHAAKIFAVVKMLKPVSVFCFGDDKQIPILPFVPGFEFSHSHFPFTSVVVKRDTWRSPADVCFVTSQSCYYGFHVFTHNPVLRSMEGPLLYVSGQFQAKPLGVMLLTYTQIAKEDLLHAGVSNVITIGESQGQTFDEVWLYRDTMLGKPLYYDLGQALVAMTRHKKKFVYITVGVNDNSAVAVALQYLCTKRTEPLLAAHSVVAVGRSPVVVNPVGSFDRSGVSGRVSDWADDEISDFS